MSLMRVLLWPFRKRTTAVSPTAATTAVPDLTIEQYEALTPIVVVRDGATEVTYCTPNRATKWRADTLFAKEPDTIEWIRSFAPNEMMVDIGANVGMYTIWAAKTRGTRVYAFEPESQNFALLYKNIMLNGLAGVVTGFCAALTDKEEVSLLHLSTFEVGGSCHSFGERVNFRLQPHEFAYAQGCFSTTLDNLVARGVVPVPNHIKIDVDGLEHRVLAGCQSTLKDARVKSVLVEINTNVTEHRRTLDEMAALGFTCSAKQVADAIRREGPFKGIGNHVFRR